MNMNNMKVIKTVLKAFPIVLFIIVGLFANGHANAEWQNKLEPYFDIVSTFDDLDDWKGSRPVNTVDIQGYPNEFPVKTATGEPSIWQYYSLYQSVGNDNWIQYHGAANTWRGIGKSMSIDYTDGADGINRGPGRFGFKIGDSPDDGYDTVHLFFMTKWFKNFFKMESGASDSFAYHKFLKTLDISAGFKDVRHWGTSAEHNWVASRGGKGQTLYEYGMNAQVYNYYSYGGGPRKEIVKSTILVTGNTNTGYANNDTNNMPSAVVGSSILYDQWFGIEYRVKKSNPHGAANGEIEVWVYDKNGNQIAHQRDTGIITLKDGNTAFNHRWNKFVWGGNRYAGSYCSGDPLCEFGPVDYFYLDDVIVDGSRIGPSYFELVKGNTPVIDSVPNPKNLRVVVQ